MPILTILRQRTPVKSLAALFALIPLTLAGIPQTSFDKGLPSNKFEIPVFDMQDPSLLDLRDADHATVAMNDSRDIVVAFHSTREDISSFGNMKQVEFAYFKWQAPDTWEHLETTIVGSIDFNPIGYLLPTGAKVKCERPDVVAVGDKFFIVWTRIYSEAASGDANESAVLECAWIERDPVTDVISIFDDPAAGLGQGFQLDKHVPGGSHDFWVRECAGVPDAVVLNGYSDPTVAVVYPHQKDFSHPTTGDLDRLFTLRLVTCSIDSNNVVSSNPPPEDIIPTIPFNGPDTSAGLILPDLAPSPVANAFWVVAESQTEKLDSQGVLQVDGSIRLDFWRKTGGAWNAVAGKTFQTAPNDPFVIRRRPLISSYPVGSPFQGVSLAFNEKNLDPLALDQSANVIYKHWVYDNGSIIFPPSQVSYPNKTNIDSGKPAPLRGRDAPYIRRCYADESPTVGAPPDRIRAYDDLNPGVVTTIDFIPPGGSGAVGRPAASYLLHDDLAGTLTDYLTVTWEKVPTSGDPRRIWIGVE